MSYAFTERAQNVIQRAQQIAMRQGNPEFMPLHILLAMFEGPEELVRLTFEKLKKNPQHLKADFERALHDLPKTKGGAEPAPGSFLTNFLEGAELQKQQLKDEYLSVEHFLLAGPKSRQISVSKIFEQHQLSYDVLLKALQELRGNQRVTDSNPEGKLGVLDKYAKDLTQLARDNKLDPVIGRDSEVRRVIQILSRRTKNNPVLIGEPGVGKTAIAEGLAQRIVRGDVPENLKDRKLLSLDIASLVAGAKFRGEFEERLKAVLKGVQDAAGQIILFIDEIHTIVKAGGAEGAMDAGNMLKPALARGELRCIGATTLDEYRIIEKDPALERRFQPVMVNPPSVEDTIAILRGLKERYEIHHGVRIKDSALVSAATLSDRYIADRFLPDKAIDLIDEAASRLKIQLESVPEALDTLERRISQLKIEQAALAKENDADSANKKQQLEKTLNDLTAQANVLRREWMESKNSAQDVSQLKKQIDDLKAKMADFERKADYARASEIKFGELPKLEQRLAESVKEPSEQKNKGVRLKEEVDTEDIAQVVSHWTGIPVNKLFAEEKLKLLSLEDELRRGVIGQDVALTAVANAVRLSRSGLRDPNRPMGSFLFLGATGVGKTETAKTLARYLFDSEKSMVRIDMSEYMEEHTVAKLIGSPPGYVGYEEGGQLTEVVRRKPYCVVLFDEIEKAHPKVLNVLLQMLDDGRLTDSHGRTVNFSNTIIIMTSNIGAIEILKASEQGISAQSLKPQLQQEMLKFLRPEFLNRIDDIIIFNALSQKDIEQITKVQTSYLAKRLAALNMQFEIDNSAVEQIAKEGWDPHFGARPLKRAIQEHIEVPLSRELLSGRFPEGSRIRISWNHAAGFVFECA